MFYTHANYVWFRFKGRMKWKFIYVLLWTGTLVCYIPYPFTKLLYLHLTSDMLIVQTEIKIFLTADCHVVWNFFFFLFFFIHIIIAKLWDDMYICIKENVFHLNNFIKKKNVFVWLLMIKTALTCRLAITVIKICAFFLHIWNWDLNDEANINVWYFGIVAVQGTWIEFELKVTWLQKRFRRKNKCSSSKRWDPSRNELFIYPKTIPPLR